MALKLPPKLVAAVGAGAAAVLLAFVPHWEGTVLKTYRDPIGIITACDGHTGLELRLGQAFTPDECATMLASDLTVRAHGVQDCIAEPLSDGELAADVSLAFNIGVTAFCSSTLARKQNAGDHAGACAEFSRWDRAGGQVIPGLSRRRAAERALCEGKPISSTH